MHMCFSTPISVSANLSSRLINLLGLSNNPIPLSLREQFGYSQKNAFSIDTVFDATTYDGTGVVPVSFNVTEKKTFAGTRRRSNSFDFSLQFKIIFGRKNFFTFKIAS